MALRMVVNDEQGEIDHLLESAPLVVRQGGRMVIISFMSLEDRKIKQRFREWQQQGLGSILTKRPLVPGEREVWENAASRSAKLRAFEWAPSETRQRAGGKR